MMHGEVVTWASGHTFGSGKVAVLIPGHDKKVLMRPMIHRAVRNVIEWLESEG